MTHILHIHITHMLQYITHIHIYKDTYITQKTSSIVYDTYCNSGKKKTHITHTHIIPNGSSRTFSGSVWGVI